jgi:hypothetical protein
VLVGRADPPPPRVRHQNHPRACHQTGLRLLRWALIEAVQHVPAGSLPGTVKQRIITRRGKQAKNIAKVAAARRLLTLVYYGMRDGQVRCLSHNPAGSPPARAA